MKTKAGLTLAMLAGLFAGTEFASDSGPFKVWEHKPSDKPVFTDEELALVRSLPKKERKVLVAELRRKYAKKG